MRLRPQLQLGKARGKKQVRAGEPPATAEAVASAEDGAKCLLCGSLQPKDATDDSMAHASGGSGMN